MGYAITYLIDTTGHTSALNKICQLLRNRKKTYREICLAPSIGTLTAPAELQGKCKNTSAIEEKKDQIPCNFEI